MRLWQEAIRERSMLAMETRGEYQTPTLEIAADRGLH